MAPLMVRQLQPILVGFALCCFVLTTASLSSVFLRRSEPGAVQQNIKTDVAKGMLRRRLAYAGSNGILDYVPVLEVLAYRAPCRLLVLASENARQDALKMVESANKAGVTSAADPSQCHDGVLDGNDHKWDVIIVESPDADVWRCVRKLAEDTSAQTRRAVHVLALNHHVSDSWPLDASFSKAWKADAQISFSPVFPWETFVSRTRNTALFQFSNPSMGDLRASIKSVPKQVIMTSDELTTIVEAWSSHGPCNMLIFGVGHDTPFWRRLNAGGRTVFLEENPKWLGLSKQRDSKLEGYIVKYTTHLRDWQSLLAVNESALVLNLPAGLASVPWDMILVDAPTGWRHDLPGRMTAIATAAHLAAKVTQSGVRRVVDVVLHDTCRVVEHMFSQAHLNAVNLRRQVRTLRHYRIVASATSIPP